MVLIPVAVALIVTRPVEEPIEIPLPAMIAVGIPVRLVPLPKNPN